MRDGLLGFIDTPRQGNQRPAGVTWCADNGAFSDAFDEGAWWEFLTRGASDAASCRFAVAPDVVADAAATLERSTPWLEPIRGLGYPVAFVAQNGIEDAPPPWDGIDALFLGGTTEWKLGPVARGLSVEARARGKWLHVGRVNSERRYRYAAHVLRADSADGTFLTYGPDTNMPRLLAWLRLADQQVMEVPE